MKFKIGDEVVYTDGYEGLSCWKGVRGIVVGISNAYDNIQRISISPTPESVARINHYFGRKSYLYPCTWLFYSSYLELYEVPDFDLEFSI